MADCSADTAPSPLRVLTLSTLFPNAAHPQLGGFVARQTQALAQLPDTHVEVMAPLGVPPWPLRRLARYRAIDALPFHEQWQGLRVWRPRYLHLPGSDGRWDVRAMVAALAPVLQKIRQRFPFDVLAAQYFFPDGPVAVALGRHCGVPVSIKARGSDIHYWGHRPGPARAIIAAGHAADGLLAVSAALKADMVALGLPAARIAVHHNGVDQDLFQPRPRATAKADLGVSGPLMVTLGALIPRKQQAIVIAALAHLPDVRLALIGDGPDRAALEQLADTLGVAQRLLWLGQLPPGAISPWLAGADVMVLPSRSEGLANAWLEALACGTPIVITDVGGAREVLTDPRAGRIVVPNPADIAQAAQALLHRPPAPYLCRALATRFTWTKNAQALRDHLAALVRK